MERAKDYLELINPHWVAVVGMGMYTHIRQICIIGLCNEEDVPFEPCYASILFIFSVLCLLAEYKLWPRSLKEPPGQLLYIYEMLVSALITNLATRAVWIPLMHMIACMTQESSKWLLWLNSVTGGGRYSSLASWAYYMAKDAAATHMTFCMAILAFVWMLDATESLEGILDSWAKDVCGRWRSPDHCNRITFENPEVTDRYYYVSCNGCAQDDPGSRLISGYP